MFLSDEYWGKPTFDITVPSVSAPVPVDAALLKPIELPTGKYHIKIKVSGTVEGPVAGAAHFSFHGTNKLITIPTGKYANQSFTADFIAPKPIKTQLVFGLGGWSAGSGTIRLDSATFERFAKLD